MGIVIRKPGQMLPHRELTPGIKLEARRDLETRHKGSWGMVGTPLHPILRRQRQEDL